MDKELIALLEAVMEDPSRASHELISLLAQVVLDDYATDIKDWYIQHEWEPYASLHRLAAASTSVGADD